ncbi:Unknown protein, partial [Striga hermonthica]
NSPPLSSTSPINVSQLLSHPEIGKALLAFLDSRFTSSSEGFSSIPHLPSMVSGPLAETTPTGDFPPATAITVSASLTGKTNPTNLLHLVNSKREGQLSQNQMATDMSGLISENRVGCLPEIS